VAAGEYVRAHHPGMLRDQKSSRHFHHGMFHGFDFDATTLRIGSINMLLHGVENPDIRLVLPLRIHQLLRQAVVAVCGGGIAQLLVGHAHQLVQLGI
jgi:type I restriction-modification system DNA methylase subunit